MKLVNYRLKYPFAPNRMGVMKEEKVIDLHSAHVEILEQNNTATQTALPANPND